MEIFNENKKRSYKDLIKYLSIKRITFISLLFFVVIALWIGGVAYGTYLSRTGQTAIIKMFLIRTSELDFSYIPKHIKSKTTDFENLSIDIKFINWQKIKYDREKALNQGNLNNLTTEEVNAKIRFKNKIYKCKISLTGQTSEHFKHPYKWSLLVKLKNGETIKGVNKFALLYPQARGYLTDWIAFKLLKSQNVIGIKTDFIDIDVNGKNHGLYYFEERFGKNLLINNNLKDGIIFKRDGNLKVYELNKEVLKSEELSKQLIYLKKLLHSFYTNKISVEKVFDIKKFATLFVVSDIMNQKHALFRGNSRLYFNPVTNLIEPIGREWGYLRKGTITPLSLSIEKPDPKVNYHEKLHKDSILVKFINSYQFIEEYIKQAEILSNKNYLDSIIKSNQQEFDLLNNKIFLQNPFYIFPIDLLYKNQEIIRKKLNPVTPSLNVFFNQINKDSLILDFENRIDLPIEIHYLKYNKTIITQKERLIIKSKYKADSTKQTITFNYITKKFFKSNFSSDSLEIFYSILGLNNIRKTIVFNKKMRENDYLKLAPTKKNSNFGDFSFLKVNGKTIIFPDSICEINKDLIIPSGFGVTAKPGCVINIINSAKIISYSPFLFFGNKENPIKIMSSDSTGQGIVVFNSKQLSEFSYVNFDSLSNIKDGDWELNGVITFYESTVNINHCTFNNNKTGKAYLNIIRSEFNIFNSTFSDTYSGALDIDFSTGNLENVNFQSIYGNAINCNGSKTFVKDVEINKSYFGIIGEKNSNLKCNNIKITNSNIGVISKDNTTININKINIDSTYLAFSAFQEITGFGPGIINLKNSSTNNIKNKFLIEVGSSLIINDKIIISKTKKVAEKIKKYEERKSSK